jgi:hypothetical protein
MDDHPPRNYNLLIASKEATGFFFCNVRSSRCIRVHGLTRTLEQALETLLQHSNYSLRPFTDLRHGESSEFFRMLYCLVRVVVGLYSCSLYRQLIFMKPVDGCTVLHLPYSYLHDPKAVGQICSTANMGHNLKLCQAVVSKATAAGAKVVSIAPGSIHFRYNNSMYAGALLARGFRLYCFLCGRECRTLQVDSRQRIRSWHPD